VSLKFYVHIRKFPLLTNEKNRIKIVGTKKLKIGFSRNYFLKYHPRYQIQIKILSSKDKNKYLKNRKKANSKKFYL
jgi:hypothetical protein